MSSIMIIGGSEEKYASVLNDQSLSLVEALTIKFGTRINDLLAARSKFDWGIKEKIEKGVAPLSFIKKEEYLNGSSDTWCGPAIPQDLQERHVELTGPAGDARMVFNSFISGADAYMADFEDSLAPSKKNVLQGQLNLYQAVRRTLCKDGKPLPESTTTLLVRPRGLHLIESHIEVNQKACPAALVDFGLFISNNAHALLDKGSGPYFYLPKLEHWQEAKLWADVFMYSEAFLSIPKGSIRATVLIETITAAYEMDAILYALKSYSSGLNCGRWDYIFSFIKKLHLDSSYLLPDRKLVGMGVDFMRNYSLKVVQECHKRGVHAMGGMSANVPYRISKDLSKSEKEKLKSLNQEILDKIIQDKTQEAQNGHDGAWAAHPGLVPVIKDVFKKSLHGKKNQIDTIPYQHHLNESDLLQIPDSLKQENQITESGLRTNISVGLQYVIAWLNGSGAVGISYMPPESDSSIEPPRLMEDLATAEISRSQIFQWLQLNTPVTLISGKQVPIHDIFQKFVQDESNRIKNNTQVVKYDRTPEIEGLLKASKGKSNVEIDQKKKRCVRMFEKGCDLFLKLCLGSDFTEFIPDLAYIHLTEG